MLLWMDSLFFSFFSILERTFWKVLFRTFVSFAWKNTECVPVSLSFITENLTPCLFNSFFNSFNSPSLTLISSSWPFLTISLSLTSFPSALISLSKPPCCFDLCCNFFTWLKISWYVAFKTLISILTTLLEISSFIISNLLPSYHN
ncbi:hypothetical protein UUR13_0029 [Ureaplasma urealyticum serovar 13 str. ATCC 33698]|nr:hypothetical protein UUR13_0029 [Ureaplasma urealyticum serovar 13 str. ATCC 33698]